MTSRSPNSNLPILTTNRYLAIPAPGKRPVFEEIAGIALGAVTVTQPGASPLFAPQVARLFPESGWLTVEDSLKHLC